MSDQDQNQNDEGKRAQREHIKRLEAEIRERDERLAQIETDRAAEAAARRADTVKASFTELGLPAASASLYPADADTSADAVAEWASTHGISAVTPNPSGDDLTGLNGLMTQSYDTPPHDDVGTLGVRSVVPARQKKTPPTEAERLDALEFIDFANHQNERYEREIVAGRARPVVEIGTGYGGRVNPPAWADRTKDARAD